MNLNTFKWRSFKARVIFFMLVIFLIGIWALAVCVRRMRCQDMHRLLGEQQFVMVDMGACLSQLIPQSSH